MGHEHLSAVISINAELTQKLLHDDLVSDSAAKKCEETDECGEWSILSLPKMQHQTQWMCREYKVLFLSLYFVFHSTIQ